jgi:hypothetical protein
VSYHRLIVVFILGIASLLAAGDIARRTPAKLEDLPPAEQRKAWRDTAIALLILIDAIALVKYGLAR